MLDYEYTQIDFRSQNNKNYPFIMKFYELKPGIRFVRGTNPTDALGSNEIEYLISDVIILCQEIHPHAISKT